MSWTRSRQLGFENPLALSMLPPLVIGQFHYYGADPAMRIYVAETKQMQLGSQGKEEIFRVRLRSDQILLIK